MYDTDDATYLRPAFTPNTPFQKLRRFDKVARVVASARWVSVVHVVPDASGATSRVSRQSVLLSK
ncbi:MAG: hypothetical protein NVSMB65_20140 [Chloroflexota bacterium]